MVVKANNRWLRSFVKSVWLFPVILTVLMILLTSQKISGSSIGQYYEVFYDKAKDPNLIVNHPEAMRSDEWLVTTQLTIAQHAAGYPRVNPNIDSGRDMTVVGDAPAKDWSTIFRPQNFSFFIMPFEYAFAFKWWFLLYMVIVSCYFLALRILKGWRLFAAIFSTAIGCSPFLFWWYATGSLAPIFYGFFIILLSIRIINGESAPLMKKRPAIYSRLIYALGLGYLLTAFALVLYPPYQIPIAVSIAFVVIGLLLSAYGPGKRLISKHALSRLAVFLAGIVIAGSLVFAFFRTRSSVVNAITNTAYPGKRTVQTEGSSGYEILSTFLQPQLQRISRASHYYTNQSEASNFILLLPFLFIPGLVLTAAEYKKFRKINWPLLSTQVCIALFLAYLFIPQLGPLYKLFFLNQVANVRLFIGLGFIGAIQLLLIIRSIEKLEIGRQKQNILVGVYTLICLAALAFVGEYARTAYPEFIHAVWFIGFLAVFFAAIIFCFLSRRPLIGALLLMAFTAGSIFRIHPLYRGMGPVYNGQIIKVMQQVSKPGDSWVTLDSLYFENFALMAGRDSLSGVKPYPDLNYWRQVDGPKYENIYNRYAHVTFSTTIPASFYLNQADNFQVQFSCNPFVLNHVRYALSSRPLSLPCINEVKEVHYPATTFYIYRVSPGS